MTSKQVQEGDQFVRVFIGGDTRIQGPSTVTKTTPKWFYLDGGEIAYSKETLKPAKARWGNNKALTPYEPDVHGPVFEIQKREKQERKELARREQAICNAALETIEILKAEGWKVEAVESVNAQLPDIVSVRLEGPDVLKLLLKFVKFVVSDDRS